MPNQITASRENLLAKFRHPAKMTNHWITDFYSSRRKVRFIQRTLHNRAGGHNLVTSIGNVGEEHDCAYRKYS
jgi:hypothetical protein